MICSGGSLIIQSFGLIFIRDSHRWLTKAKHWTACPTSLQHFKRSTVNIFSNISILQMLSMAKMLDFLKRKCACSLVFGVGVVVLHQMGQVKAAAYYGTLFVILVPGEYISFLSILEGFVNNIAGTRVVSTYETSSLFLALWTCQPANFEPVEVSIATSSLPWSSVVKFLDSNLEDKVLIEDGSIVVNQVNSVRAYGLERMNEIGSSKMLECFIWDPEPTSIWLKRENGFREGYPKNYVEALA